MQAMAGERCLNNETGVRVQAEHLVAAGCLQRGKFETSVHTFIRAPQLHDTHTRLHFTKRQPPSAPAVICFVLFFIYFFFFLLYFVLFS